MKFFPRKPIVFDCMIIRVGLAGCLCKRGLFIHGEYSFVQKPLWDLNGPIIRRLVKASLKLQT